jgi:hypothetical protein
MSFRSARQEFLHLNSQIDRTERLCHERVCSAFSGAIGHLRLGMRGKHKDLDLGRRRILPQATQHFPAVKARETDIENDHVWFRRTDLVEACDSVDCTRDLDIEHAQTDLDQPSDRWRIFDDEYALVHTYPSARNLASSVIVGNPGSVAGAVAGAVAQDA